MRRNHRGGIRQTPKPKGGRVRSHTFWHAIAAGIRPQSNVVADFDVWFEASQSHVTDSGV